MYKSLIIITLILASFSFAQTPSKPTGVAGIAYEKHFDIVWNANPESNIAGYKIYKWDGSSFVLYTMIAGGQLWFSEWTGAVGVEKMFKVSAYNQNNIESLLSDSVKVVTKNMSDDEFLDMVQRASFRYFYDYGHPVSGLARERLNSGNTVTSGGSGFGIMALVAGVERNFITRTQGVDRMLKILNFLINKAQRYHGVYAHWLNGETGETIPFSTYDNGGDLVETSFLLQGLLTARQYFNSTDSNEVKIRNQINTIWNGVEWTWYRRASFSPYLYWHWSPNYGFQINMKLTGWNETMICYLLGIASTTYHINASSYYQGWASNSNYVNGSTVLGYKLWVGSGYGGPLFFTHYSFLGFDPRFKKDAYANYFFHNRNQTLVNRAYCILNPKGFAGYNENSWGLTACDNPWGYSAHEPYNNDNGTIAPTAALSSMPYTPNESIAALKYFYRTYGNNLWGSFGFKDAFNLNQNWYASSYLAIDQGPIMVMIENHRSKLLWNLFMSAPEIDAMVDSIFTVDSSTSVGHTDSHPDDFQVFGNYPNPFNPETTIEYEIPSYSDVNISVFNTLGEKVCDLFEGEVDGGKHSVKWNGKDNFGKSVGSGVYIVQVKNMNSVHNLKVVLQK